MICFIGQLNNPLFLMATLGIKLNATVTMIVIMTTSANSVIRFPTITLRHLPLNLLQIDPI